jgi:phosphomannomutase
LNGGKILVGRDTRPSGEMVRAAVIAGLISTHCEVIDLGICPTPSLQLAVRRLHANGAVAITAGHNPENWNALKFVRADGVYLNARQGEELLDIYHQGEYNLAPWDRLIKVTRLDDAVDAHIDVLLQHLDVGAIQARHFTVAVDCCNGACALLTPRLLEKLGCQVVAVNDDLGERFPHDPNPSIRNMAQLRALVKASHADIGFCHDADGERLGIVTEDGEALPEERTLVLLTETVLCRRRGTVVTNLSTTEAVEAVAKLYSCPVIRTAIGQPYIAEAVKEHAAVLGGEGSGGVLFPEIQYSHDSAAAIGFLLQHLAWTGSSIGRLSASLPQFHMLKRNVLLAPREIYQLMRRMRIVAEKEGRRARVDFTDGIRIRWKDDGWLHVRDSNTESMLRIIAEAPGKERAIGIMDWIQQQLRELRPL